MRSIIFKILWRIGIIRFFRIQQGRYPIFCFHRIHPDYDPLTQPLSPTEFHSIIKGLKKHFKPIPLSSLLGTRQVPENACVITFDDALLDFYEFAHPILKRESVPVTLFVPTASVETQTELYNYAIAGLLLKTSNVAFPVIGKVPHPTISQYLRLCDYYSKRATRDAEINELKKSIQANPLTSPMNWDQLKELYLSGVQIGSHSHTHAWMPSLSDDDMKQDIQTSFQLLKKRLNIIPNQFAYPMGATDSNANKVIDELGLYGLTTDGHPYTMNDNKSEIPRFNVSDRSIEELMFRLGGFHSTFSRH